MISKTNMEAHILYLSFHYPAINNPKQTTTDNLIVLVFVTLMETDGQKASCIDKFQEKVPWSVEGEVGVRMKIDKNPAKK